MDWDRADGGAGNFYDDDQIMHHDRGFGEHGSENEDGKEVKLLLRVAVELPVFLIIMPCSVQE